MIKGWLWLLRWSLNITFVLTSFGVFYGLFKSMEIAALLTIALSDLYLGVENRKRI